MSVLQKKNTSMGILFSIAKITNELKQDEVYK